MTDKTPGERAADASTAIDILPPDPKPPGESGAGRLLVTSPSDDRLMTPKRKLWEEGRTPRQIRRRIMSRIREMSDDAADTLATLISDGRDTRVQLQAVSIALAYSAGKPGEDVTGGDVGGGESVGTNYVKFLTPEEKAELSAALKAAGRIRAIGIERMRSDG